MPDGGTTARCLLTSTVISAQDSRSSGDLLLYLSSRWLMYSSTTSHRDFIPEKHRLADSYSSLCGIHHSIPLLPLSRSSVLTRSSKSSTVYPESIKNVSDKITERIGNTSLNTLQKAQSTAVQASLAEAEAQDRLEESRDALELRRKELQDKYETPRDCYPSQTLRCRPNP